MYKLENNVEWTDELKSAFKHNVTRSKVLWNGDEINENNHLKNLKINEQYYVSNLGFVGVASAKKAEINLLETDEDINLENQELELKIGADYEGNTYYINYGKFIVNQAPENDETNGTIRVVAYDYMIKFNKPYEDRVVYPCTLLRLLQDICSQAGVIIGDENFANKDFIVEDNQFEGFTLRGVLQHIAKCAFSWARIGQDNKLYLDFNLVPETTEIITINDYKLNSFKKANEYYGPINQVTYADSDIEGQEERVKDQQSIDEHGLKELVIYDNLFAYTAEKRHELIQAGTRLLGLWYMPISQLELIGLAYLDCRDAIAVQTLAEESFTSRVFSHEIIYNGTLHDSIVTEGTSNNEEAYKNTATNVFQNQQTQIKVDRANKNIKLLAGEITEQNNKIAQLEITTEGIEAEVANIYTPTNSIRGNTQIVLENCIKGYLLKLRILGNNDVFSRLYPANDLYPSNTLYPKGDSRIVVTDSEGNSMVYELRISDVLRANDEVYDEYILEDNFAKVIRRVNPDGTTKELETEEIIGTYTIYLGNGTNTIIIQNYNAIMEATYVEQNGYTDQFATKIEMNTKIEETENAINLEVSRKIDEETTGANIILKINNDESEAIINADKISLEGKEINMTSDNIEINSTNFSVTKDGRITATSGDIGGFELNSDNGFLANIISKYTYTQDDLTRIQNILLGNISPTVEDYEKYDFLQVGYLNSADYVICGQIVRGDLSGNAIYKLDTQNTTKCLQISDTIGGVMTSIGLYGAVFPRINCNTNIFSKGGILVGHDAYNIVIQEMDGMGGTIWLNDSNGEKVIDLNNNARGQITCVSLVQTSKESVKKNIEKYLENASDIVKNSEIYKYNFKSEDNTARKHIGFVIGDEGGNYKTPDEVVSNGEGIDTYTMTSILWKAVQEQQELIEQMQKEINELKGGN